MTMFDIGLIIFIVTVVVAGMSLVIKEILSEKES